MLTMFPFIFIKDMFHLPPPTLMLPRPLLLRAREYSTERRMPFVNNSLTIHTFYTKGRLLHPHLRDADSPCSPTNSTWPAHTLNLRHSKRQVCIKISGKALSTFGACAKSSHKLMLQLQPSPAEEQFTTHLPQHELCCSGQPACIRHRVHFHISWRKYVGD